MTLAAGRRDALCLAALLALLLGVGLARPLLPIDETRYAGVAWEMWLHGDFLLPLRNGAPYDHKPPLLFWLIHAGWWAFGVNEWWLRVISPLFAGGTLVLTALLGRRLWPERPAVAQMAPYVLLASALFAGFVSALMFDTLLSFFVALGLLALARAGARGADAGSFALLALAFAGGLYAKGPVVLLHLLPPALLAPWWLRGPPPPWQRWWLGVAAAVLAGAAAVLAWAIPAALAGGPAYREAIFWGQSAGRLANSFAHRAPWYTYVVLLPLILAPWFLWPAWWAGLRRRLLQETGFRFVLVVVVAALLLFSAASGKRVHYLLPEFGCFALLVARALDQAPPAGRWLLALPALCLLALGAVALAVVPPLALRWIGMDDAWPFYGAGFLALACGVALIAKPPGSTVDNVRRIALASVLTAAGVLAAADRVIAETHDIDHVAGRLAAFEREGRPLAVEGSYHDQWTLAGRLRQPVEEVATENAVRWLAEHPTGRLVYVYRQPAEIPPTARVEYSRRYRGAWLAILAPAS